MKVARPFRNKLIGKPAVDSPRLIREGASRHQTTAPERWLLMGAIVLMPLQDHLPNVAGFSLLFLTFGTLGTYLLVTRPYALISTAGHPVFLVLYTLLALCFWSESLNTNSDYFEVVRIGYMVGGAVVVAGYCRDRKLVRAGLFAYLVMGIWLSLFLIFNFYGALDAATATNLREAGRVRGAILGQNPLTANLNKLAFQTAQGAVVALGFALAARSLRLRILMLGTAVLCMVAVFVPMSRGGIVIAVVSGAAIMFSYKGKRTRALLAAAVLGAGVLLWAPSVALTRLSSSKIPTSYQEPGAADGRIEVWIDAIKHLPEYAATGVGYGNFWGWWAKSRGLIVAHNSFLQITIYWGFAAALVLGVAVWQVYRCLPKGCGADPLSLCLLGLTVSLVLRLLVSHNLADKDFALGIGLLVGARHWIWQKGTVAYTQSKRRRPFSNNFQENRDKLLNINSLKRRA